MRRMRFISLLHYKHAIPLIWLEVPYGGTDLATAVDLVLQGHRLIPPDAQVVFYGDNESTLADPIQPFYNTGPSDS